MDKRLEIYIYSQLQKQPDYINRIMRPPQQHCTFLENNCPLLIKGWKMRSILVLLKWSFVAIQEAAIILIVWSLSIVTSKKSIMNESNHIWYHLLDDLFPLKCITSNDEFGLLSIKRGLQKSFKISEKKLSSTFVNCFEFWTSLVFLWQPLWQRINIYFLNS